MRGCSSSVCCIDERLNVTISLFRCWESMNSLCKQLSNLQPTQLKVALRILITAEF